MLAEAERAEEAEFEAGEEQRGAVLERAGRGVMQDAQQQKGVEEMLDRRRHRIDMAGGAGDRLGQRRAVAKRHYGKRLKIFVKFSPGA